MQYFHIVTFQFKPEINDKTKTELYDAFNNLKSTCKKPDGSNYILELKSSQKNISPEGAGKELEHAYILTFQNQKDALYYIHEDPVHQKFATWAKSLLQDAFIYDFEA